MVFDLLMVNVQKHEYMMQRGRKTREQFNKTKYRMFDSLMMNKLKHNYIMQRGGETRE
jgi:hypothetical protein